MATINRAAIKSAAKAQLKGNLGILVIGAILFFVILAISAVTCIGFAIVGGPLILGFMGMFLMVARGQKPTINNLFDGFSQFLGAFVAFLLSGIFTVLWSLLFIIPGIIAALRYSQVYYILKDNPDMDGLTAITKSKEMMKGHKGELFVLGLSFILWILLGSITLGIAYIWIGPYMSLTYTNFYEELKKQQPAA